MSPLAKLTFGAIQSLNSISSTLKPCFFASLTAASSGMANAAVVPTFNGASAAWVIPDKPRLRSRAATGRAKKVLSML
ncbi:hypothetical protein D3C72_2148790 [compost metagenome]